MKSPAEAAVTYWSVGCAGRCTISSATDAACSSSPDICACCSSRTLAKVFRTSVSQLGVYLNDESKIDFKGTLLSC
jgi:hypothetical protein